MKKPNKDTRFELRTSFDIMVPKDYHHATQLATFKKKHQKEFYYYNNDITDKNFGKVTTKLTPGKTYQVTVFHLTTRTSSEDCLQHIKSEGGVLVGAQGLSLVYEQAKEKLPKGYWYLSFDEKANLPKLGGNHHVPRLLVHGIGGVGVDLSRWGGGWRVSCCVLVFRDSS